MSRFAVNGKTPVSVWCPSRDDAGNGTTALNDLVGSNHGTLTNMDAATDWVADTDAGGIRALDFDGTNDYVLTSYSPAVSAFSISLWVKYGTVSALTNFFAQGDTNLSVNGMWSVGVNATSQWRVILNTGSLRQAVESTTATSGTWNHLVATYSGSTLALYRQGSLVASVSAASTTTHSGSAITLGARLGPANLVAGRVDDARFFTSAIDASDVSYLYNSGSGRGRLAATRSRNHAFIGVAF